MSVCVCVFVCVRVCVGLRALLVLSFRELQKLVLPFRELLVPEALFVVKLGFNELLCKRVATDRCVQEFCASDSG